MTKTIRVLSAATLGFTLNAIAAEVSFPNADGSNDIASDAAWGGAKPSVSDIARFMGTNCTHTAKSDVTFGSVMARRLYPDNESNPSWSGAHATLTFDMRPEASGATAGRPRTIKLSSLNAVQNGMEVYVRGGVWDFQKMDGAGCFPTVQGGFGVEDLFEFSDGAVITNVASGYNMFNVSKRCRLRLTGGSTYWSTGPLWPFVRGSDNAIEILDGSTFRAVNLQFGRADKDTAECSSNRIVVAGAGSRFINVGYTDTSMVIGCAYGNTGRTPGNILCATNGACVLFDGGSSGSGNFVVGEGSHSNMLLLDDGASLTGGTMHVGKTSAASNNYVFVGANSTMSLRAACSVILGCTAGADGNTMIVSNGTVNAPYLYIGNDGSCSNRLRVCGPKAVLSIKALSTRGGGVFQGGASARGNALEIDGGAKVDWTGGANDFYMGGRNGTVSIGSAVSLSNGSTFTLQNFFLGHTNSTENVLSIDATSQLKLSGGNEVFRVYSGNTLELTVPPEGYVDGVRPVHSSDITFESGSVLKIDASAYLSGPKRCKVFRSYTGIKIDASVLEAANAALGKTHTLELSADRCDLYLRRHNEGMTIILR